MIAMMLVVTRPKIMGKFVAPRAVTIFGSCAAAVMCVAVVAMLAASFTG